MSESAAQSPSSSGESVLFLDCDGVLNCRSSWPHKLKSNCPVDPEKAELLNRVVRETGCRVVMSSTWRRDENCREILQKRGVKVKFHDDWRTPFYLSARGEEIADWLRRHPEVKTYAIIDDDGDMLPEQRPYFVKTTFEHGLMFGHADLLIEILKG